MKIIIAFIFVCFGIAVHAQNKGFEQNDLEKIKEYQAYDLENGFKVINLNNNDSSHVFLRLYTELPQNVNKQYRPFIEIEQEIRNSSYLNLPKGWTNKKLDNLNLNLKKDHFGYYLSCPLEQLDTAIFFLSEMLAHPVVTADHLKKVKNNYKTFNTIIF